MKLPRYCLAVALLLGLSDLGSSSAGQEPLELGSRRELFVDRWLVDRIEGLRFELHAPRDEGTVLQFDRPWEGPYSGYLTVLRDGAQYRLFYRGRPVEGLDGDANEYTCLAESEDGIHWTRPTLALFEVRDAKENNVVLANPPFTHNFTPLIDPRPDCPPDERYKALAGVHNPGLHAFASPDGIRWRKLLDEPIFGQKPVDAPGFVHAFDSQNVGFWSEAEGKFLCYFRSWENEMRRIYRAESDDFRKWTRPRRMEYQTNGRVSPLEHMYTNQTSPYFRAPHIYLAIAARFMPGRQIVTPDEARELGVDPAYVGDTSDAVLMSTRGGAVYDRTFLGSFIRPGIGLQNWVSRTNYPALNVVQTSPTELSLYVNQDYAQPTAHVRRYSLRLDGFASLRADYEPGELVTRPLRFAGRRLLVNFATSAAGSMRVEIQDAQGKPLPGYALDDSVELLGNEIERAVRWTQGTDIGSLAGQTVRLRFVLKDADLFALQFAP